MWEAIRANQQRSWMLILLMGALLMLLGGLIGASLFAAVGEYGQLQRLGHPSGVLPGEEYGVEFDLSGVQWSQLAMPALYGVAIAAVIWLILWLVAYASGDRILLGSAGAREIQKEHAPQLWNVVEEMTIASGLGRMPKVYVIDDEAPNAFAVGRTPERAAVAVTSGLLERLKRDELQGVIAHEIGHVRNLDIKFMTLAGVMMGSIVLLSDVFLRSMFYGGGRRRSSGRGGGGAQLVLLLIAIVVAVLAPLAAQMLYFACSRRREYLADASSARFTRLPEGLAGALEKISDYRGPAQEREAKQQRVLAPMYIVNPRQLSSLSAGLFSTHPPTQKRIQILRSMAGGAGFASYESAFRLVEGSERRCIGGRTLQDAEEVPVRPPSEEQETRADHRARRREAHDLAAGLADYVFLACACGLRLKIPPDFKQPNLRCPRCGREHEISAAGLAEAAAVTGMLNTTGVRSSGAGVASDTAAGAATAAAASQRPHKIRRTGQGWESFRCPCGATVQMSPAFQSTRIQCRKCRRWYEVETP